MNKKVLPPTETKRKGLRPLLSNIEPAVRINIDLKPPKNISTSDCIIGLSTPDSSIINIK